MSTKELPITGLRVGKELLERLGLSGQGVRRITLDIPINDAVTITLEKFATQKETDAAFGAFADYQLMELEPNKGVYQYSNKPVEEQVA